MSAPSSALGVTAFLAGAAILGGLLAAATGVGLNSLASGFLPGLPAECPAQSVEAAPLSSISVTVQNASGLEGLAAVTAARLKALGVDVVATGNKELPDNADPLAGVVISGPSKQLPQALAVQGIFPESVFLLIDDDGKAGTSVYLAQENPAIAEAPVIGTGTMRCLLPKPAPPAARPPASPTPAPVSAP